MSAHRYLPQKALLHLSTPSLFAILFPITPAATVDIQAIATSNPLVLNRFYTRFRLHHNEKSKRILNRTIIFGGTKCLVRITSMPLSHVSLRPDWQTLQEPFTLGNAASQLKQVLDACWFLKRLLNHSCKQRHQLILAISWSRPREISCLASLNNS